MSNYLYDSLEINAILNYIRKYTPLNLNELGYESKLIKNNELINFWTYILIIKKPNYQIKKFIENTYIGLPIELNKIISKFIPDYKEISLNIDLKAENIMSQKIVWIFNSIECNLFDIKKTYSNIDKVIKANINDFLNKKTITKYCPCRELSRKHKTELFEKTHYDKCNGSVELKKFYSEHFLLDHIVLLIKEII